MSSTLSSRRSELSAGLWPTKPSVDATLVSADPENDRFPIKWPSLGKWASRSTALLITFFIGVAATLAWQSSREIATPPAASFAQTAPDVTALAAPTAPSLEEQLEAMSLGLAAVRQSVDDMAAGQERMTRDITKLQEAQQDILDKISAPPPTAVPTSARKPIPQPPPVR